MYPFSKSAAVLEKKLKEWRASGLLHEDVLQAIKDTRPYDGGDKDLWTLNGLCNVKKHKMVLGMVANIAGITFYDMQKQAASDLKKRGATEKFPWPPGSHTQYIRSATPTPVEVGDVIRREPPGTEPDHNLTFPIEIGFERPEFVRGESINSVMDAIVKAVDRVAIRFGKLLPNDAAATPATPESNPAPPPT